MLKIDSILYVAEPRPFSRRCTTRTPNGHSTIGRCCTTSFPSIPPSGSCNERFALATPETILATIAIYSVSYHTVRCARKDLLKSLSYQGILTARKSRERGLWLIARGSPLHIEHGLDSDRMNMDSDISKILFFINKYECS